MEQALQVSLVGLGAIGCVYAPALQAHCGDKFCVVVDPARKARYEQQPVVINGQQSALRYESNAPARPDDVILIATKRNQLESALSLIAPRVGPDTVLLSLLNGIDSEGFIEETLNIPPMLAAYIISTDATRTDAGVRYDNAGVIHFGEKDGSISPRAKQVEALFARAGIAANLSTKILKDQWWKYMLNCGLNSVTAVLRVTYGMLNDCEAAHDCMMAAMREVITLSKAEGVCLDEEEALGLWLSMRANFGRDGKPSMFQDIEAGRPTENEMLCGTACSLGRKHGIPTPANEMLYRMIKTLEWKNEHGK